MTLRGFPRSSCNASPGGFSRPHCRLCDILVAQLHCRAAASCDPFDAHATRPGLAFPLNAPNFQDSHLQARYVVSPATNPTDCSRFPRLVLRPALPKATVVIAACFALTRPLASPKSPGCLPSPRVGCRRACPAHRVLIRPRCVPSGPSQRSPDFHLFSPCPSLRAFL